MNISILSYDQEDIGGSGITLRIIAEWLCSKGHRISRKDADVLLTQQWATKEANDWARTTKIPMVMFVHGPGQYEHFRPDQCKLVVFNTEDQRKRCPVPVPSIVLHPPVFRQGYEVTPGGLITLIGTRPAKGIDLFLDIAREIPEEDFLLVTDVPVAPPPNVMVDGLTRNIRSAYRSTKLLLMPSTHESYGRVVVEAAMSGIPAIVADLPGLREATADRAVFVPPGSPPAVWAGVVREVLGRYYCHHSQRARELADLRDPVPELEAFHEALMEIVPLYRRELVLSELT